MSPRKRKTKTSDPGRHCKDCPPGSKRPAPYPGQRCATHDREVRKNRKTASRGAYLLRTYNITEEQYNAILEFQGGVCAICGPYSGRNGSSKNLSVDHDHSCCNKATSCGSCVRGLLCSTCNKYLGLLRDSPEAFQRGINYLTDPPARKVVQNE